MDGVQCDVATKTERLLIDSKALSFFLVHCHVNYMQDSPAVTYVPFSPLVVETSILL